MNRTIWDFWLRSSGSSTNFHRLNSLSQSALWEQLLCALIRSDVASAKTILEKDPQEWMLPFLGLIQENALAGLVLDQIFALNLRGCVEALSVVPPDFSGDQIIDGVWYREGLLKNLQRAAGVESSRYDDFDDELTFLLDIIDKEAPRDFEIVFPKGISLSRTLYAEPHHRLSGDIDCIIKPEHLEIFLKLCSKAGYRPIMRDAALCNQFEVGPTDSQSALFCTPTPDMVPSAVVGLGRKGGYLIDPKFNPLDRGLAFKEIERFRSDLQIVKWRKHVIKAPSTLDHLLLSIVHYEKDRFSGWKSLIDIHLLCQAVTAENAWSELLRRVHLEGVELGTWAALSIAHERLGSEVPLEVIEECRPRMLGASFFSFTVEPLFYWNCASLFSLYLNALFAGDSTRKLKVISKCVFPSAAFLGQYYGGAHGAKRLSHNTAEAIAPPWKLAWYLILHWLVLALPALIVRRTFGRLIWPGSAQYSQL